MEPWKMRPAHDSGLTPIERMRSPLREGGLVSAAVGQIRGGLVGGYLKLWHRFTIHGADNIPHEPPFLLVANHASHLDALALAAALPRRLWSSTFPLAAGDTFFESPWSSVAAAGILNALPVWRKRSVGRTFQWLRERLVSEPCAYILFPEGTRSRNGRMGEFKAGIGMLAAGSKVPVIPCFLSGCFGALPRGAGCRDGGGSRCMSARRFASVACRTTKWDGSPSRTRSRSPYIG